MSTIIRICEEQEWSDAQVVQMAFQFLENEGLLAEFLDFLQAVAVDRSDDDFEGRRCEECNAPLDSHGSCTNPECRNDLP
jgi:hypothetical protein